MRAIRTLLQVSAFIGLIVSLFVIYIGLFIEPPRDQIRFRYIMCDIQVQRLAQAVEAYKGDFGFYPDSLQSLISGEGIKGWRGPYVKEPLADAWGRPFLYVRSSESAKPEVISYGADGKPGGNSFDADISSRDLQRNIPEIPFEKRIVWIERLIWIGAWICFVGCIVLLTEISRRRERRVIQNVR